MTWRWVLGTLFFVGASYDVISKDYLGAAIQLALLAGTILAPAERNTAQPQWRTFAYYVAFAAVAVLLGIKVLGFLSRRAGS